MKVTHLALTLFAGISIGIIASHALRAEPVKPPAAYVIAEVEPDPTKSNDPDASRRYSEVAPKTVAAFGGQFLVRGARPETMEGEASKGRIVVIAFDSLEKARGWYSSPEYGAVRPIRQNSTKSRLMLVEGVAR